MPGALSYDVELTMADAVAEITTAARWKLRMLARTRRFYTDAELVTLYKAHLMSVLESGRRLSTTPLVQR